jgi:cation transport regulator ChaB
MVYKSINSLEDEIKEESPESGEEIYNSSTRSNN